MENTEILTKKEYQFLRTMEKKDVLIQKLEEALEKEKTANATLKKENEELKAELAETVKQCQEHVDNVEYQMDEMEKKMAAMQSVSETDNEGLPSIEPVQQPFVEKKRNFLDKIFNR